MIDFQWEQFLSIFIAITPPLLIVRYFYFKLASPSRQKKLIYRLVAFGLIITIPTLSLEFLLRQMEKSFALPLLINELTGAFLIAALCEESAKFLVTITATFKNNNFSHTINGIVYTIAVSMGFAQAENLLYLLRGGLGQAILRTITALPLHALSAGIMGYYIGKTKFLTVRKEKYTNSFKGLLYVVMIHGTYNFLLATEPGYYLYAAFAVYILLIFIFLIFLNKIKTARNRDEKMRRQEMTNACLRMEII